MPVEIHQYDIGTAIEIEIKDCSGVVNVSSATTKQIRFYKPNKERVVQDATFLTDGVDGKIQYIFADGDLDTVGRWRYQAFLIIGGREYNSDIGEFKVYENI